jgi:hypothetical protein
VTPFNLAFTKNFAKSTLMAVTIVSSTLGLRTELAIITGDIGAATWIAILWVFVLIAIISYYKSKIDVELATLQGHERNRAMLGVLRQELTPPVPPVKPESPKIGDAVFLQETK